MSDNDFREEFDPIVDLLTPRVSPKMPEGIKTSVLSQIERRSALKNFFTMKNTVSRIVASAAAVVVAVIVTVAIVRPAPARASEVGSLLDRSLAAADEVHTMTMKIYVRTEPHDSFDHINPLDGIVEHTLTVARDENGVARWRLDKERRHIVFDGLNKYLWIDGMRGSKGDDGSSFEEWFDILLNPALVPMREKAALEEGVKYFVENTDGETILRAEVEARGDFSESDYLRNSSIEESDTRREIVFDRETGLLKGLKIWVKAFGIKRLVVEVRGIEYNLPVNEAALVALPSGTEWRDVTAPLPAGDFSGITAAEAARMIADAITAGDIDSVREAFESYDFASIREVFDGARVLEIGEEFRSGTYGGVFVPLKVRFADGKTETLNLALRNDNPNGVWQVDGGI
jgi:hypothetical protein